MNTYSINFSWTRRVPNKDGRCNTGLTIRCVDAVSGQDAKLLAREEEPGLRLKFHCVHMIDLPNGGGGPNGLCRRKQC